ncbi:MAG TPA: hypothetical protein VMU62_01290, partial [Acidobacteriaceae bacterium]|nr:hypothetical protein [Acidobacteriaceae bacterium]
FLHQRIHADRFRIYIQIFLIVIGIILLAQAVHGRRNNPRLRPTEHGSLLYRLGGDFAARQAIPC